MKAVFISFNQAYNKEIEELLLENGQRGFTQWNQIQGQGSDRGEPHFGDHAWPVQNNAIMSVMDDEKVQPVLDCLKQKDEAAPDLGLRAFVWNIEAKY